MEHSSSLKSLELLNLSTNDINTFSRVFHNLANSQIEVFSADLPSASNGYVSITLKCMDAFIHYACTV